MASLAAEPKASLTPAQQQVILALAAGSTITAAARQAGVHRSTIHKWLENEAFAAAFRLARLEFRNTIQDQLEELTTTAFDTIRHLMTSPDTPPAVRLRAALAVLKRNETLGQPWALPDPVPALRDRTPAEPPPTQSATVDTPVPPQPRPDAADRIAHAGNRALTERTWSTYTHRRTYGEDSGAGTPAF